MALAASWPFRRISSVDYCCEEGVAHDREEVLDRIARTTATNRECFARADDLAIRDRLMPVLQGRVPDDYVRSLDAIGGLILPGTVVGIGSMCRRPIHGPEGLIAVVERLTRILPIGVKAHLFGVKGDALPYLTPFARWIASDRQPWMGRRRATARAQASHRQDRRARRRLHGTLVSHAMRANARNTATPARGRGVCSTATNRRPTGTRDRAGSRRDPRPDRERRSRSR